MLELKKFFSGLLSKLETFKMSIFGYKIRKPLLIDLHSTVFSLGQPIDVKFIPELTKRSFNGNKIALEILLKNNEIVVNDLHKIHLCDVLLLTPTNKESFVEIVNKLDEVDQSEHWEIHGGKISIRFWLFLSSFNELLKEEGCDIAFEDKFYILRDKELID